MNDAFQTIVRLYARLLGAKTLTSIEDKDSVQKIIDNGKDSLTPSELRDLGSKLKKYHDPKAYSFQWDDASIKDLYDQSLKPETKKKNVNNHIKELQDCLLAFKLPGKFPRCLSPLPYDRTKIKAANERVREALATLLLQNQAFHERKYPWEIEHPMLDIYFNTGVDKNLHKALEEQTPLHVKTKEGNKDIMPLGVGYDMDNEPILLFENHKPLLFSQIIGTSLDSSKETKPFGSETTDENLVLGVYECLVYLTTQNAKERMIKVIQKRTYNIKWIISPRHEKEVDKKVTNFIENLKWPWRIPDTEAIVVVSDEIYETFRQRRGETKKPIILESEEEINELIQLLQNEVKTSKDNYETLKCIKQIKGLGDSKPMLMAIKSIRAMKKFF